MPHLITFPPISSSTSLEISKSRTRAVDTAWTLMLRKWLPHLHPLSHQTRPKTLSRPPLNRDEIAVCSLTCRSRPNLDPMIIFQPSNSIWPKAQQMRSRHFLGGKGESRDPTIPQRWKGMEMKLDKHQKTNTLFQEGVPVGDLRSRVGRTKTMSRKDGGMIL